MTIIDLQDINKLADELCSTGKPLPYWLEMAIRKAKHDIIKEQIAERKMIEQEFAHSQQQYQSRINSLFDDFDKLLPDDFKKFKTPQLESSLDTTKQNIKQFATDMHRLSELAGGSPTLEDKAVKITANLLDRLKNDLELTPLEKKQLEGKSFEEVAVYYSQTRSGKMDRLNNSIDNYRQELQQLEISCQGRSKEEINKLYEEKLHRIEQATGQGKIEDFKIENRLSKYEASIDDIKSPPQTSQTISDKQIEQMKKEKYVLETIL